jgi:hypothetical protein
LQTTGLLHYVYCRSSVCKRPAVPSGFSISACFSRYVSTTRSRTRRH